MESTNSARDLERIHGAWNLDPAASTVAFEASILGLVPVHGAVPVLRGSVEVAAGARLRQFTVTLDATGFTSGSPLRDNDVRGSHFLDVAHHPDLTYVGTRLVRQDNRWQVEGELTVRGTTGRQVLDLDLDPAQPGGSTLAVGASTVVDRVAYGITWLPGIISRTLSIGIIAALIPAA